MSWNTASSGPATAGNIFWKFLEWCAAYSSHYSELRQCLQISSISTLFLIGGTTKSHTEPCQGSRVVAERQESHDLPKIPGWNVLCVPVHCRDVVPRPPPPVSVASCEKHKSQTFQNLYIKLLVYSLALCDPKCTHSRVKKSVSEFFDHTLRMCAYIYSWIMVAVSSAFLVA